MDIEEEKPKKQTVAKISSETKGPHRNDNEPVKPMFVPSESKAETKSNIESPVKK